MSAYTITAERTGHWWVLQAVEAPGAISQVARLDQADTIKEAIAFVTGEPEAGITITVLPSLPAAAEQARTRSLEYRAAATRANAQAAIESRKAARALAEAGLSRRDIGTVLSISPQRAQQLVTTDPPRVP